MYSFLINIFIHLVSFYFCFCFPCRNILKLATMLIKEFEKLQGIFGKDRANGRGAERCEDAMENQIGENQVSDDDEWLHQHDNSPSFIGNTFVGPPSK